ncbi:MAG: ROK family protein [Actinomycetota bacterium]|nr:ROK family protein [Actinomycetota bacterium]
MTVEARASSRESPGSTTSLRAANLRRVIDVLLVARDQEVTQADLTRTTGLAAGTVSSIVRELAAASVVDTVAGSGRRGTTVRLARGAGLVAGVDFGHSHVGVAVGDMTGGILVEDRMPLDPGHEHQEGLDKAAHLLDGLLRDLHAAPTELRNVGLGLPAPISDNVVMSSAIMPGWVGVNPHEVASARFGRVVQIDNDANLGALAEHRHGGGQGYADMVFVKVSSGVGAGMIINNQLFRGSSGTSGEIGHLTLDDQGPLCRCGSRGCLEAYAASGTALSMMAEQMPDATVEEIIDAAREGNVAALRVFEDAGLHLGWGLAALTNLMNPGVIVVGGDMGKAGDLFLDSARSGLRRHVLSGAATTPVVPAKLGDRASVIGAMLLAIDATDLLAEAAS